MSVSAAVGVPLGIAKQVTEPDKLQIGYVAKARGLRGELGVVLHWKQSDALGTASEVVLKKPDGRAQTFCIQGYVASGKGGYLRCRGVDDREAAESWRGAAVLVSRSQAEPLQPGEYYLVDLVGCRVEHDGQLVGKVKQVVSHPSVDSAVIELASGGERELPLLDGWIERVDTTAQQLVLASLDGLID